MPVAKQAVCKIFLENGRNWLSKCLSEYVRRDMKP